MTVDLSEFAPAKINLCFHITGRRADGYHLIDSITAFTSLGDTVYLKSSDRDHLSIDGPFSQDAPSAWTENSAGKAVDFFRKHITKTPPLHIYINKRLPSGGGLGGGTADAAAVLRALAHQFDMKAAVSKLPLEKLGADVPVCFHSTISRTTGIGEIILPLSAELPWSVVLVKAAGSVSTPLAYQYYKEHVKDFSSPLSFAENISADHLLTQLQKTTNDLTSAARHFCPVIGDILSCLHDTSPVLSRVTGSGGACFALYATKQRAEIAASHIRTAHPSWWVETTDFFNKK